MSQEIAETPLPQTLHLLAAQGNAPELEKLLLAGASPNLQDHRGVTPLHLAVARSHVEAVQTLLRHGADVRAQVPDDLHTPLHTLARYGNVMSSSSVSILRALWAHGAQASDLIARDIDGNTPFHWAALNGDAHLLEELFILYNTMCASSSSDADHPSSSATTSVLDLQTDKGRTPLHAAALSSNIDVVRLLVIKGASKHVRDAGGATPFHHASIRCRDTSVLEELQLESVNDVATGNQFTALHFAARSGCSVAVTWLLNHGALADATDKGLYTPLHLAAINGKSQVIQSLILQEKVHPQTLGSNRGAALAVGLADEFEHHDAAKVLVRMIKQSGEEMIKDTVWIPHNSTGASLLHYFAAYGTVDELKWILELIQSKTTYNFANNTDPVNTRDKRGRTAVHWAAMRGNIHVVSVLAQNKADLNAQSYKERYNTPLSLAVINGDAKMEFAEELLKWKPKNTDDWLQGIRTWMSDYYSDEHRNLGEELAILRNGFIKHTNVTTNQTLFSEIPSIYLALHAKRDDIAKFIQRHSKGVEDAVNEKGERTGYTALHWATLLRQREIVAKICRDKEFSQELTANAEDKHGKTALQYAKEMKLEDIEKELMLRSDVQSSIDGMYKDRQVYVDAANAILVGAALIAGVTFAGWLQPPLSYTPYYNLPQLPPPSPPDMFQAYAAVQQHMGVRLFWIFNSLSFSFAIATMIAGLVAVVPIPGTYIATAVVHLRRCLRIAAALLGLSIVFVLAAFAAAGFAVLPPVFEYQANMMATVIVGGIPCLILLAWFAYRLLSQSRWVRAIETQILSKLHPSGISTSCEEDINLQQGSKTPGPASPNRESKSGQEDINSPTKRKKPSGKQ